MPLLGAIAYDPATAVTKVTTSATIFTAFDTVNARIVFVAPTSGRVVVHVRVVGYGATTMPQVLLGVLESSTVRVRVAASASLSDAAANTMVILESFGPVTGLTPGTTYTWDAAYGVERPVTSTSLRYGGGNSTTANDAYGALVYEIYAA